jgi:hypothetical protein
MSGTRRPIGVYFLSLFILCLSLWNGLRLIQAIHFWPILNEYKAYPGPLYVAISGGLWLLVGLFLLWGFWRGRRWAWFSTLGSVVIYTAWYWSDRLILQEPHPNWPFALLSTVISILFFGILFRRKTLSFFRRNSPPTFHVDKSRQNSERISPDKKIN